MTKSRFHKHIYKTHNTYTIVKSINGTPVHFKSFKDINEAMEYRDYLVANNWEKPPETEEEKLAKKIKHYYKYVSLNTNKRRYKIYNNKGEYIATVNTIEEALYYRDLFSDCPSNVPKPSTLDLTTDNPYLLDGLRYPLPERLVKPVNNSKYGKGAIVKKSKSSYVVMKNKTRYARCRTYEQAYYVKEELNKCNWDKNQVERILSGYPKWYTELQYYYRYISRNPSKNSKRGFVVNVPKEYSEVDSIERYAYSNLEDALFERDFLVKHEWDYDLLVECINDEENPYYNQTLPPFPERKVRNVHERKTYTNELNTIRDMILNGENRIGMISRETGYPAQNIRMWLRKYDTYFRDFVTLVESGEDIWSVLSLKEQIFTPDLSPSKPSNYKGYVHRTQSKRSPYCVSRKGEYYGSYKTKKQARKVVNELKKVDWDKTQLKKIQEKVGYEQFLDTKRWVYPSNGGKSFTIRKKDKSRKMINYGSYPCLKLAERVRDLLIEYGWDKSLLNKLRERAENEMINEVLNDEAD